jgi:hypothetical protein
MRGASRPFSVDDTSSIAEAFGVAPVALIPTFCAFTELNAPENKSNENAILAPVEVRLIFIFEKFFDLVIDNFELTVHLRLFLILYNIDFQRYKIFRISKRGQKEGTNYEKKEV